MGLDRAETWLGIVRDSFIVVLATFMLTYETVFVQTPNVEIIGAALALFGLPPVLRLDLRGSAEKRASRRAPRREKDEEDYEDRWSHMP